MEYQPRHEKDLRSAMVLSPGVYDFDVASAKETFSKKGNEMLALELRVYCNDGTSRLLRDWLVPGSDLGDLKFNRFAHATGLQDEYFAGTMTAFTCEGRSGKVRLTVQADEEYGDQNRVKDYVVPKQDEEMEVELRPEPKGVPAKQTKAANKRAAAKAADAEDDAAYADEEIPF